jgi:two-component system, OmpR family, response regulator
MSLRILAVEDDMGIRRLLERGLRLAGHEVVTAEDVASARAAWQLGGYDVVLLDVMLPDGDGIALLDERRAAGDRTPAVLLTAREEEELSERAHAAGASAHLAKPFAYAELLRCLEEIAAGSDPAA